MAGSPPRRRARASLRMGRAPWRWLALARLALLPSPPVVAAAEPIEVKVVVRARGSGPDEVGFVYSAPARGQKARQTMEDRARDDFRRLATALGQPSAAVKVNTVS